MTHLNRKIRQSFGFTLIELMIVVAIISILATIAIPKFADLIRKSKEGATKGNLGAIRSALSIYYSDMEGVYPCQYAVGAMSCLPFLTVNGKYLSSIPLAYTPDYHPGSSTEGPNGVGLCDASGGWNSASYVGDNGN